MKTTPQHTIDRVTDKIPAPEIVFRNKKSLRRRPAGLRRVVVIATSGVAAAIVVSLWALLGTPSDAPLPTAPITAHKPNTPAADTITTQPIAPEPHALPPKNVPAQPKIATKPDPTTDKLVAKQEIAQIAPQEPTKPQIEPQKEEPKTEIVVPRKPVQVSTPQNPMQPIPVPKAKPEEKSHLEQLIADLRKNPKRATNLSARKLDKEAFRNPNLIALAEDLNENSSANHLVELFSKKTK